ncbi:ATP-binding protein [Streptomyces sp. NPDC005876]|jgi:anti-sigma regulatory factor (Ser/Thr protein kinase)|uniref:ATP-binding protein n=1 Tax=unclassified Streptomyces TaxID=2593676 RepID=UPI0033D68D4D
MSAAYEGVPGDIARARDMARAFLLRLRSDRGLPVSRRAVDVVQLVVSELLTNACKHAPGPTLLDLELTGEQVLVTVWDTAPTLPVARDPDPGRVGQHGLEIVMAVCENFVSEPASVGKRTRAAVALADAPVATAGATRPEPARAVGAVPEPGLDRED